MGHPKMPSGADTVNQYTGDCVSMSSTKDTTLACIINSEVGAVLAVMRRNVRWADHYLASNDQREHPLIQSLMTLRRQLFSWHHRWRDIDPCIYLEPFLDIIQSGETSAPITGVALSSVYKVLILDMIDEGTHSAQNAMQLVVDAVTSCRFEVTDPASEEVVLMKILQVLLACMKCKGSVLLSNKHVFTVVNTCFSIVHQAGSKGELLQRIARSTMHELVRSIFAHLQDLDKTMKHEAVGVHTENGYEGKLPSNGSNGLSSSGNLISDSSKILSVQTMDGNTTKDGDLNDAISSQLPIERDQYGIPCMVDILHLFASLLNAVEHIGMGPGANSIAFDEDVPMFALGLINSAVELGGASFRYHPTLLSLVKDELFLNILQYGLSMSPLVLSMVFNIILSLYCHVGTKIKLQLESFFSCVILKLTQENLDSSYPQQEVALEALVDFCRQKGLMVEMYVNLDCDMTCSNVFENVVDVLARRANPDDGPLSSIHMLALDGLMAIITGMIERIGNGGTSSRNSLSNLEEYMPIWKIKCENYDDPDHWVPFLQWRKQLKKTLMMGVDQFNSDCDLGFEFLQKAHLLPEKLDPESVACLFRYAPGLDKNIIGDYLGSHDLFCIQTLHAFAGTFDFQDMSLDTALRLFLETFRLPGESQKIQRILEAFSERYFVQSPNILANKDAALLLSYSLIMLNTDQHNTQVKKKMTEEEFIRNNRHINGGSDLPREYLSELYHSICKNEISFTGKSESSAEMTPSHWIELIEKSKRADPFIVSDSKPYLDRDMFSIMAGPTIAAITAVFDLAEEDDIYQRCIDGFLDVAKVAASHHLEDVLDNVVVSLCRFTVLFNLSSFEEPVLGEDMKARMAIEAIFKIANLYGDSIRVSWRTIVDCILKLHKLGLLPAHMASEAVESDPKLDSQTTLISPAKPPADTQKRPSSGLISKFSQLFSFDIDEPTSDPTEQELAAHKQAVEIIESCHVDTIFAESKFLQAESLLQLSQALIWVSDQYQKANGFPAEEDTGTFCLELLVTITLNNRDRIGLLWQCVYEHIAKIVQSISIPCALVEKAVFGLLRICQRLLPYKETLSDELLKSLQLVLKLDARVADTYCEQITREIGCLVKSSAAHIKSQTGWRAIVSLLSITARHPEASEPGFEALFFIMSDGAHLLPVNYLLCVDASRQFAESRVGGSDRSLLALDVMSGSIDCLSNWAHEAEKMNESDAAKLGQDIGEMWLRLVQGLRRLCSDQREDVRNHAVLSLQNCLIGADKIRLSQTTWSQCFESAIFVMIDELVEIAEEGGSHKDYRNMEGTLVLALKLVSRVFLQMLNELSGVEGFDKLWVEMLNRMEKCMNVKLKGRKSERVRELVPELLKNTLLVMKARGVLVGGERLWDTTWTHVNKIVPSLQSELFKEQELKQKQQQDGITGEGLVSNEMSPVPS